MKLLETNIKMIIKLNASQVLLNRLYIPIIKNGNPSIIKSKEAKEFTRYVQMECIRQKVKPIKGPILFYMDILISKRKNYDIDASLKLLFDSLNKIAFEDDKNIVDLRVRKHLDQEEDSLVIKIEGII